MNNNLQIFEGQKVEVFEFNGKVLFNPYDVGKCLDIVQESVRYHTSKMNENQKIKLTQSIVGIPNNLDIPTAGRIYLTESGVYRLAFKSRKPQAERFANWVTDEVLPSIRKHGAYLTPEKVEEVLLNPDTIIKIAQSLKEEQEKRRQLEIENNELKPKANYCEQVLQSEKAVVTTQIAKDYGMSPQALNSILHELGVQYKVDGQWVLYSKYQDKGYTKSCTVIDRFGEPRMQTKWTQKGRLFIYQMLKTIGVLPNMEKELKKSIKKTKAEKKVSPAEPIFSKLLALYENKEISKAEFARCCSVTSPTLNKMISKYREEMCS